MGCNCKANQYIRQTKKRFDYNSETVKNVSFKNKFKIVLKSILILFLMLIGLPITIAYFVISKFLLKNKRIKLFNAITIRL